MKKIPIFILMFCLLLSCENKTGQPVYEDVTCLDDESFELDENEVIVPFRSVGGVKYVRVTVNGVGVNMIFDTGCSGALISVAEANYLYQKGLLSMDDIIGFAHSQIADGSIVENMVVNLREVVVGDAIICHDVEATVSNNIDAPLLLGNGVLDRAASYTVDNENEVIRFKIN